MSMCKEGMIIVNKKLDTASRLNIVAACNKFEFILLDVVCPTTFFPFSFSVKFSFNKSAFWVLYDLIELILVRYIHASGMTLRVFF